MIDVLATDLEVGHVLAGAYGFGRELSEVWDESGGRIMAIGVTDSDRFGTLLEWDATESVPVERMTA